MKISIQIPLLRSKVILLVGDIKSVRRFIPEEISRQDDGFTGDGYIARSTIIKSSGRTPNEVWIHSRTFAQSVIAHEAIHAYSFIADKLGIVADHNNDELQAYFVQLVLEEFEIKVHGDNSYK